MLNRFSRLVLILFITGFSLLSNSLAVHAWKWIAYGDTRTNDAAHRSVLHSIKANTPDYTFIINVGDVVEDGENQGMWQKWQQACDDELGGTGQTQTPPKYMSVPGNHDKVDDTGLVNWNTYLPGQAKQYGHDGKYFVFDYQNARFILLNTQGPLAGEQLTLLMQAIQNNPQTWLFVIWHKPVFDFGPKNYEADLDATWATPLYQHGCDFIINGHAHYYLRTYQLGFSGQPHPPLDPSHGTVQLVSGNSGAPLYPVDENRDDNGYLLAYSFDQNQPGYYGYTEFTLEGSTCTLKHIRTDGTVMDSATYAPNPKTLTALTPVPQAILAPAHTHAVHATPNPAKTLVTFFLDLAEATEVKIKIYNEAGEQVTKLEHDFPAGQNQVLQWNCQTAAPGEYTAKVYVNQQKLKTLKMKVIHD